VAVVTAISSTNLPEPSTDPAEAAAGEGMIDREVVLRVDQTIWHRQGAPEAPHTFTMFLNGWWRHDFVPKKFVIDGMPWVEVGSQYLMPLDLEKGEWSTTAGDAVFPYHDSVVAPEPSQTTPLALRLANLSAEGAAAVFATAQPDKFVARHFGLRPRQRVKAVARDERRARH
jgi:hypothetical protein